MANRTSVRARDMEQGSEGQIDLAPLFRELGRRLPDVLEQIRRGGYGARVVLHLLPEGGGWSAKVELPPPVARIKIMRGKEENDG